MCSDCLTTKFSFLLLLTLLQNHGPCTKKISWKLYMSSSWADCVRLQEKAFMTYQLKWFLSFFFGSNLVKFSRNVEYALKSVSFSLGHPEWKVMWEISIDWPLLSSSIKFHIFNFFSETTIASNLNDSWQEWQIKCPLHKIHI